MLRFRTMALIFLALIILTASRVQAQEANAEKYPPGLIVITVAKGSPAELAGLKVGDMVLSLEGTPLRFDSQIAPLRDKAIWEGKKALSAVVRRGPESLTLNITAVPNLGLATRPPLPTDVQKLYDEAVALTQSETAPRLAKLKAGAEAAEKQGDLRAAAWLWYQTYSQAVSGSEEEGRALNQALRSAGATGDLLLEALCRVQLGDVVWQRGKLDAAEAYYKRALAIRERVAPRSVPVAESLINLGNLASDRGKSEEGEAFYKRAYSIFQHLAPGSLDLANSLTSLGYSAAGRGALDEAVDWFQKAWRIVRDQGGLVIGDTNRQEFGRENAFLVTQLVIFQVLLGHVDAALVTLEEGRSQALVQSMADRGITEKVTPREVWRAYEDARSRQAVAFKEAERAAAALSNAEALRISLKEQNADGARYEGDGRGLDRPHAVAAVRRREDDRFQPVEGER